MARTLVAGANLPGSYAAPQLVVWTALDATDGGEFTMSGDDIALVRNTDVAARTVTMTSVAAGVFGGRTGNLQLTLQPDEVAVIGPMKQTGWAQTDGRMRIGVSGAGVEMAVRRIVR